MNTTMNTTLTPSRRTRRTLRTRRHPRNAGVATLLAATLLVGAACGSDDNDPEDRPIQERTSTSAGDDDATTTTGAEGAAPKALEDIDLSLEEIGSFDTPISIRPRPDDTALFLVERPGKVFKLNVEGEGDDRTYTPEDQPLLDISDQVTTEGERGLLDVAFSPDGKRLYVSYSALPDGTSTIVSYDYDGTKLDTGSRREILTVSDFASNHNGGDIEFGPDGYLYIAMGDGGGAGDPEKNGQDTESSLLAKVLRIDPEHPSGGKEYSIPEDNPFADGQGGKPETWLYGVRNPWRFSFDRENDDLWIGDVGQDEWEEIDWLPAADGGGKGANLGWSEMEGSHPYNDGSEPDGAVLPVYEYAHGDDEGGCSITGGVVYRGTAIEGLQGAYLFADYCTGIMRAVRIASDKSVSEERSFDDASSSEIVSINQDNDGEVYVVSLGGKVYRLAG
jgi:glucose/arabinose dehydrogenase